MSCNILIIRCFFGCLGGCSANVKIWLAVFAWANDYSPLQCREILIRCPADRNPSKTESNHSNRMFCLICCYLPDFSRSDFLISFGASAPLSNRSTQPPINRRNVARHVSTHQIEYHANKKGGVTTSLNIYVCLKCLRKIISAPALQSRRALRPLRLMSRTRALSCLPPSAA